MPTEPDDKVCTCTGGPRIPDEVEATIQNPAGWENKAQRISPEEAKAELSSGRNLIDEPIQLRGDCPVHGDFVRHLIAAAHRTLAQES